MDPTNLKPGCGSTSTQRPGTLDDDGVPLYEGHDIHRADMAAIYAVGRTPREAIEAFCLARMGMPLEHLGEPLGRGNPAYEWGFSFVVDGTGCKAAGINVPGGVVLTWWK